MLDQPLRLAVGSHKAGSGKGCAMNVISWENGDTKITDFPECADPFLARLVQHVNDRYCTHRDGDLLCPPCSVEVLALAHRTVGTSGRDDGGRVWARIAVERACGVAACCSDLRVSMALDVVDRWLVGDATSDDLLDAATAAWEAKTDARVVWAADKVAIWAARAAWDAAGAAAWAAGTAAGSAARDATWGAACAASAAAWAAEGVAWAADLAAPEWSENLMRAAHEVIDRFEELTGYRAADPDPAVVQDACRKMLARTPESVG